MLFVSSVLFFKARHTSRPCVDELWVCVQKFSSFSVDSMHEQLNMWHVMLEEYFGFLCV